jgi:putative transposase
MARLPRLVVSGVMHLVAHRSLDVLELFRGDDEHRNYLAMLAVSSRQCGVDVHAYALLPGGVLLLVTPGASRDVARGGLSLLMQSLAREHVREVNQRRSRVGTLWHGRYQAAPIEAAGYGLACWRYVEQAPVRAGLVEQAADYPWSSGGHYVGRASSASLVDHPARWALGNTPFEREAAHRALLGEGLSDSQVAQIEATALRGWALGSAEFVASLQMQVPRRLQPAPRGRPRKASGPCSE